MPSPAPVPRAKRTSSPGPSSIRERIRALKPTGTIERKIGKADARKVTAPSSTVSLSIPASGAGEMYLESEEWVLEDPKDWAAILTEMRSNVQSRAASLLGHGPIISNNNPQPSGPKVYLFRSRPCCYPPGLIKPYTRAAIRHHRAIWCSSYGAWRSTS